MHRLPHRIERAVARIGRVVVDRIGRIERVAVAGRIGPVADFHTALVVADRTEAAGFDRTVVDRIVVARIAEMIGVGDQVAQRIAQIEVYSKHERWAT